MTIRLVSTPGAVEEFEDRPPYGVNSKGDYFRQTSILRNAVPQFGRTKGARVGTDDFTLKFLSRTKRVLTGTTRLPGGTLRIKEFGRIGVSTPRDPVVGGTGVFEGARGTLEARALPSSGGVDRTLNVYRLTLP
jgi:hypothetical protein